MRIFKKNQYNQSISKYKLLSSTAGVGSIVTTKFGTYVLILDFNKWKFMEWANNIVERNSSRISDKRDLYEQSKNDIIDRGLKIIDDRRFIEFIKKEKDLENLVCLINIPHMTLNEIFNTPKWKEHPIKKALDKIGERGYAEDYMIQGIHFPKWFKNRTGELKKIEEWIKIWRNESNNHGGVPRMEDFAPPKDGGDFRGERTYINYDGIRETYRAYRPLEQLNLLFICPNGHLSDIPWSRYLRWKTEKTLRERNDNDRGDELFKVDECCRTPKLKWTESKTRSEGYGSVFIECLTCGLGSGDTSEKPKVNLEGINSLEPYCIGEKPWESRLNDEDIPCDGECFINADGNRGRERMKVTLVTANNLYFANMFSSLYIPQHLATGKSDTLIEAIHILENKFNIIHDGRGETKQEFWDRKYNNKREFEDLLLENGITVENKEEFFIQVKSEFLNGGIRIEEGDTYEEYRWQEYRCFSMNESLSDTPGLSFNDIELPEILKKFFSKIQQVEEIKVTNIQLDFTRVKPNERIVKDGVVQQSLKGKNIFSCQPNKLYVLPANEILGEGIFFEFSNEAIEKWVDKNREELDIRFKRFIKELPTPHSQGITTKMKIFNNGIKHFLIHTFSHILIRELEFSSGYPTASIKERLYISSDPDRNMAGVLIYTAEGSEGSMGGLVSQGEPTKILELIKKALERSINCSSDPLCWESEGQGIFDLNLSACFSCSLVAETTCEEMNLGLDRRVLVSEKYGFFKDMLG